MSIDGQVETVYIHEDGSGRLHVVDRPGRLGTISDPVGHQTLRFDFAPEEVTALNGLAVWGNAHFLFLGKRKIADRDGCVRIIFVTRVEFLAALRDHHHQSEALGATESTR